MTISVHQDVALSVHKQVITVSRIKKSGTVTSVKSFSCPCNLNLVTFVNPGQAVVAGSGAYLVDLSTGVTGRFEIEKITCLAKLTTDQVLFGTNSGVFLFSLSTLVDPIKSFDRVAIVGLLAVSESSFIASTSNQIRLYTVEQRNALLTVRTSAVFALTRVPRTSSVASVDSGGVIHFWDERKLTSTLKPLKLPGAQKPEAIAWCDSKKFTTACSDGTATTVQVFHDAGDELTATFTERFDCGTSGLAFRAETLVGNASGEVIALPFAKKACLSFSDRGVISVSMAGTATETECPARDISVVMRKRLDSVKPHVLEEKKQELFMALGVGDANKALESYSGLGSPSTEISCALAALAVRSTAPHVWRATLGALRSYARESQLGKEVLYALEFFEEKESARFASLVSVTEISVKVRWWLAKALGKAEEFQDAVAGDMADVGNLDALDLVAGSSLGVEGVRTLLREFLARTCDVQTLTELAMRYKAESDPVSTVLKEPYFRRAMRSYLELLSRWRRWKERTRISRVLFPESNAISVLKCYFCDYPLTGTARAADRAVMNRCPNELCHKALPKCAVCLGSIFAGGDLSVWTAWCAKCKHGGHQDHLLQWFKEFDECPVAGCMCECARLDGGL